MLLAKKRASYLVDICCKVNLFCISIRMNSSAESRRVKRVLTQVKECSEKGEQPEAPSGWRKRATTGRHSRVQNVSGMLLMSRKDSSMSTNKQEDKQNDGKVPMLNLQQKQVTLDSPFLRAKMKIMKRKEDELRRRDPDQKETNKGRRNGMREIINCDRSISMFDTETVTMRDFNRQEKERNTESIKGLTERCNVQW